MSDARFRDFDQFFAEMERKPVSMRLFGEDHELAPSLPVTTVLAFQRFEARDTGSDVSDNEIITLFISVFGQERFDAWTARNLDIEQMLTLLSWAMEQYGVGSNSPKAPKVQRGKPRK